MPKVPMNVLRFGLKPLAFVTMLLPFLWLAYSWYFAFQGLPNGLGVNPQEASNRFTSDWALRFLLLTLAVTPFSKLIKSPKPILFRRMIGLYALFYAVAHVTSYVWLDLYFAWGDIWADILKRTYITVGMAALLLLIPLGITSTKGWIRRMGSRRWRKLHMAVYVIAPLAVIHFFMMRKGIQIEPLVYGAIYLALMVPRVKARLVTRRRASPA